MTAVPKHWPSSRRQGERRATHKATIASPITCKHCGQPKRIGFQCPNCQQL